MSNRLYPNFEQLRQLPNPLTPGEWALIHFLDKHLPADPNWTDAQPLSSYRGWLIFAQPYFNGTRPDVVILNPAVGMVIYEVKDWDLALYSRHDSRLYVKTVRGLQQVALEPMKQARHYRDKLISQLVPNIGEQLDSEQGAKPTFGLIKPALYFHGSTTIRAQQLFHQSDKDKFEPVFGRDSLRPDCLKAIVPYVSRTQSYHWRPEWNDEIIFWLRPPFHSIEQGEKINLKDGQAKVAEPRPGHHRVRGVAGSGKTLALACRAGKLASQGHDVLVITFNITLWHYIRDMIKRAPSAFSMERITLVHFHGFCKDRLMELGSEWPSSDNYNDLQQFFRLGVPAAVIQAINAADASIRANLPQYDAVLIDEGQDYYYEWYELLHKHFLRPRDELVVVCDKKQNIYDREMTWLDKRVTREGMDKFREPFIDLTISHRLPPSIADVTNEFSELFNLNQDLRATKQANHPLLITTQHIVWVNIAPERAFEYLHFAYRRLKKEQYHPSDMVILLPSHEMGKEAVQYFSDRNIDVNHVFETADERGFHPNKKAFWMGDSRLKMSTIHSFKGWEVKHVVIYIPDYAPESARTVDTLVYTALTRTRENLIVLNANERYSEFGNNLPNHWDRQ